MPVPYFGYAHGNWRLLLPLPQPAFLSCNWCNGSATKKAANTLTVALPLIRLFTVSYKCNSVASMRSAYITLFVFSVFASVTLQGQESPYFVTYDHHLEEPGNLEIETSSTVGVPGAGQHWFFAPYLELEYGVTGRWTSELYLEGQSTAGDSTIFTGWRIENRFRPLAREHWINPVLYLEYENINEASRIRKEIVGAAPELNESNAELRATQAHELETKLILSSTAHNWNISENFIVEKNLTENEGFEFGYALAVARPLATLA